MPLTPVELRDVLAHPDTEAVDAAIGELLIGRHVVVDEYGLLRLPRLGD